MSKRFFGSLIGLLSCFALLGYIIAVTWIYRGWLMGVPVTCLIGIIVGGVIADTAKGEGK